jgi:FkbM family methyltransferase
MSVEQGFFNQDDFEPMADETDLYYCYRLLLGRKPDPGGWAGITQQLKKGHIGLDTLVFNFLRSPEFQIRKTHYPELSKPLLKVTAGGFELYASRDDWDVGTAIAQDHTYEPHVTAALQKRLQAGMVFLDIGANIGYFSMLAAGKVGSSGRVFSFEASQKNAILIFLSTRLNKFDNIHVFPFALANHRGTWMYDSHGSNGSLAPFSTEGDLMPGRSLVYAMTLDELMRDQVRADIVKIDIEGAEYMALEGGTKLLERCRPVIFSEFSPEALRNVSGKSGQDYLDLLRSLNYEFCLLNKTGSETLVGIETQRVFDAYEERQSTHIDIVAIPRLG